MKTTKMTHILGCLMIALVLSMTSQTASAQMKPDIFASVQKSDCNGINQAIANGDDVNRQTKVGNTPLMVAAKIGDGKVISALLENKAEINKQNRVGATALMLAAKYGHPYVVEELLKHGANPTLKTERGYTAAIFAQGYKHYEVQDRLLKAQKDFKRKN